MAAVFGRGMAARAVQLLGGLRRLHLAGSSADTGAPHHSRIHLPVLPPSLPWPSSVRAHGSGCSLSLPPPYPHLSGGRRGTAVLAARFGTDVITLPSLSSGREKELLEELASLTNGGFARAPVKPKPTRQETARSVAQEIPDQPDEEEVDWLKKLSDFAGSIVNGASKWLKDNL